MAPNNNSSTISCHIKHCGLATHSYLSLHVFLVLSCLLIYFLILSSLSGVHFHKFCVLNSSYLLNFSLNLTFFTSIFHIIYSCFQSLEDSFSFQLVSLVFLFSICIFLLRLHCYPSHLTPPTFTLMLLIP